MVFISGGDVEAGMEVLEERQILPFLRELFERGKPFFGSSAGSIMLGRQWVRWEDPDDDATANLFPCMGFAPIVCDTHGEAEGWEELRALLRLTPGRHAGLRDSNREPGCAFPPMGRWRRSALRYTATPIAAGAVVRSADLPPRAL